MDDNKKPKRFELPVVGTMEMDRRHALKIMALAAAAPSLAACDTGEPVLDVAIAPSPPLNLKAKGTAWDPDLVAPKVLWERTLSSDELASLAVLCDVILPADERSPSASSLGAQDFIDEWVSAPYEGNQRDAVLIRGGLLWLDRESSERFGDGLRFQDLTLEQQHAICDDICYEPSTPQNLKAGARFFDSVRSLTSTAFWTTTEGMADLQYIGNIPQTTWPPPPAEVLRHLGLE